MSPCLLPCILTHFLLLLMSLTKVAEINYPSSIFGQEGTRLYTAVLRETSILEITGDY